MNRDVQIINNVIDSWNNYLSIDKEKRKPPKRYPLDDKIIEQLRRLLTLLDNDNENFIYAQANKIKNLWKEVIESSIMCLRYYDTREPFMEKPEQIPAAHGLDDLMDYYQELTKFEMLLYGSNKHYRDYVIHAFRVWISGLKVLLGNDGEYMEKIAVGDDIDLNCFEKLSIWSLISLMHDFGYPLEKAQQIIDKTKGMMSFFVVNPLVSTDFLYSDVQNKIKDFILRLISSKMVMHYSCQENGQYEVVNKYGTNMDKIYVTRLQPKYYFKLSKSLEKSKHGIISAIIVYKTLQYFLESDFSTEEDYYFGKEDARQFYIRREILRAIASHTCPDIYHQKMKSFSYLLIIVDDTQDWERMRFSDLYYGSELKFGDTDIKVILNDTDPDKNKTEITESVTVNKDRNLLEYILKSHYDLSQVYRVIFKGGLGIKKDFEITKTRNVTYSQDIGNVIFQLKFKINRDKNAEFTVTIDKNTGNADTFTTEWLQETMEVGPTEDINEMGPFVWEIGSKTES